MPDDKQTPAPTAATAPGAANTAAAAAAGPPPEGKDKGLGTHVTRLTVWFCFSVMLALLPPAMNALKVLLLDPATSDPRPMTLQSVMQAATGQGEFQLISAALTAGIFGEMLGITDKTLKRIGTVVSAVAMVIFAFCLFSFPMAAQLAQKVPRISLLLLVGGAMISGVGVWIASMDRQLHG